MKRESSIFGIAPDYIIRVKTSDNQEGVFKKYDIDSLDLARRAIDEILQEMPYLISDEHDSFFLQDKFHHVLFENDRYKIPLISMDSGISPHPTTSNINLQENDNKNSVTVLDNSNYDNIKIKEIRQKYETELNHLKEAIKQKNDLIEQKNSQILSLKEKISKMQKANVSEINMIKEKYEAEIKKREQEYDKLKTGFEEFVREKLRK